jgi:hypothetical protein
LEVENLSKKKLLYYFTFLYTSCNGIACPILKLLLFSSIPAGDFLEIAGHPADLDHIMGTAFRADRIPTERTILNSRYNFVGAVTVVKRTHNNKIILPTPGAGGLIDNEMTGMALVYSLVLGDIFEPLVFFCQIFLFFSPLHTLKWSISDLNF